MGMFDTFLVPHRGTIQGVQNKSFDCSLGSFRLGDFLDDVPGVRVVTDSFEPDLEHVSHLFEQSSEWDRGLGIAYVVVDGRWIDYAIYPTRKIADVCTPDLIARYQDPAWRAFAWQGIEHIQRQLRDSSEKDLFQLMRFVEAFDSRAEPRRAKKHSLLSFLSFRTKQFPKTSLTWKNLLLETKKTIKALSSVDVKEPYSLWNAEVEKKFTGYFYDGPEREAETGLEKINVHALSNDTVSSRLELALSRLDLGFFKALASKNPDWLTDSSLGFQTHFQSVMCAIPSTLWGTFLWVKLLGLSKITPLQVHVYQEGFELPLSLHLLEVMGLEDSLLAEAAQTDPNLFVRGSTLHPIHSLPLHYNKTFAALGEVDFDRLSKETDDQGQPPLTQALLQALDYENNTLAFERAAWWLDHGADPNQPDANGNTPLMRLVSTAKENVNHSWVWSVAERHPGRGQSKHVVQTLLQAASFTQTNREGQTLLDLWPKTEHAQILLRLEEKRRLDLSVGIDALPKEAPEAL